MNLTKTILLAFVPFSALACSSPSDSAPLSDNGAITGSGAKPAVDEYASTIGFSSLPGSSDTRTCSATKVTRHDFLTDANCVSDDGTVRPDFAAGATISISKAGAVSTGAQAMTVTVLKTTLHPSWTSFCDGCSPDQFTSKYNDAIQPDSSDTPPVPIALLTIGDDTPDTPVADVSGAWIDDGTPVTLAAFSFDQQDGVVAQRTKFAGNVKADEKHPVNDDVFMNVPTLAAAELQHGDIGGAVYGANGALVGVLSGQRSIGVPDGHTLAVFAWSFTATRLSKRGISRLWKWDVGGWLVEQGVPLAD